MDPEKLIEWYFAAGIAGVVASVWVLVAMLVGVAWSWLRRKDQ